MKIFSGTSNKPLAEKIAQYLGLSLSPIEVHIFPDGEKRIKIEESVVDEDVVIVQSTATPTAENFMELFFIIDGVKRSGAKSIILVIPYFGYQRQDHIFRTGEAVSLDVVIKIIETLGVDKVISVDMHSIKIPELFKIQVTHLSALPLFAEKIKEMLGRNAILQTQNSHPGTSVASYRISAGDSIAPIESGLQNDNAVLVSPDMGGIRRIKMLSEMLGNMPYAMVVKNRDLTTGRVTASEIEGSEMKERVIIVDDMISSGSTIVTATNLLLKKGAEEIFVFATHPVFSDAAWEVLEKSAASRVYVTDTIDVPKDKQFSKLEILSIAHIVAKELRS